MNKQFLRFTFFLLMYLTLPPTATAQVIDIPDPNLRAAIENALEVAAGAPITVDDMATLTHLEAHNANISDLTGLEFATKLAHLYFPENLISDISPLAGLTKLEILSLWDNSIADISAVAGLINLTELSLGGNSVTDISPIEGLTNLTGLHLPGNPIADISSVAGLTQLTSLYLGGTNITDISSLSGLTNLKTLWLEYNSISDLSPLVANTGLGSGDTVNVRQNRLSNQSLYTHIPALQSRGVTVDFDNRAPPPPINTNGMVRLVYFLPSDRPARPDRVTALRQLIKDAQQFYAEQMHRHGFGRKTFTVETDADGEPLVHQVNGKFKEDHYYQTLSLWKVWAELPEHFEGDDFQHAYLIAIDFSDEGLDGGTSGGLASLVFRPSGGGGRFNLRGPEIITQREEVFGGLALIPSHGHNFERLGVTAHEIGHAFGLVHDFRQGRHSDYVMAAAELSRLSKCAAEWLSVSRFFNTKSLSHNEPGEIQLLSLRAYSQDTISFHFEVKDPDGLHQAQLLVPEIWEGSVETAFQLFDCKRLNGKTGTVEAVVSRAELVDRIALQIIDVGGNITWATFLIELDEVVSAKNILDVNSDGVVNLLDLTPFVSRFGQSGRDPAEVNGDGVIDIVDVLLVAGGSSSVPRQAVEAFTEADVQKWLTDAEQVGVENKILQKGIVALKYLLAEITLLSMPMEVATHPLKAIFVGHTDYVWSVASSPDGQTLASASWDQTIRLWDPHTAQHKMTLIGHTDSINSIAFSPDGQTLASASWDQTIRLWDPHTGKLKMTLIGPTDSINSIAFSPDGQSLASGLDDQTIRLWNTTTGQVERTLRGHTGLVEVVVFSPDGGMLASGSRDQTIQLWDPHTGKHIRTLPDADTVNRLAFSPDGDTLASGSWDNTIRLWDPHTGTLKRTLPNQTGWVNPVAFSPDGATLVIGNRGISLWDIETGQYKKPLIEDIGAAISVVFSPDGQMLASGSSDKKVRLWDFTPFLITPGLSKISGDNQSGVSSAIIANPFVIEVRDENLSVVEGISVTFTVVAGNGTLSVTSTTTDENGRAESTLTLGPNLGTNAVFVSAAGIEQAVTFNAVAEAAVDIPDANLRTVIETALGVASGVPIVSSEMETLTHLEARNANISDLTGLEGAINLTTLDLDENNITDISPVVGLTNLTGLFLGGNNISDISVLAGLTNLTGLSLYNNNISDISAVTELTNLTRLWLDGSNISDLSPLVANTGLGSGDEVYVRGNPLSYQSIHTHIPILQSREVIVESDNRTHPALLKISGDNQNGVSLIPLSQPFVIEAQDENGSALTGVSVTFAVTAGGGTLSTTITRTNTNGRAQSTLTLGPNLGTNTVQISAAGIEVPATFHAFSDTEAPSIAADANRDGVVNILDLVVIASEFGNEGQNLAVDVNGDGVVNILDLIFVAGMFDGAAAAPSAEPQVPEMLTAVEVQQWLTDARSLEVRDPIMKRGFMVLEQLLAALTPRETELLANYPNPFNPETWIPYRLAEDAFVTLTIYDGRGQVVRTLEVGHRIASAYENRSKAIYWDGKNRLGEQVASGIYFYTLTAGDYTATQKMLILK